MGADLAAAEFETAGMPGIAKLVRTGWWTPGAVDHDANGAVTLTTGKVDGIREAVFDKIISKIPAGATRVLDLGCGNGEFAKALHATRPNVIYRGIDLSKENMVAAATNLSGEPNVELEEGNIWEYLHAATVDWDFIVSTRCIFNETTRSGDRELLRLIDSLAPMGWFIYGHWDRLIRADLQYVMGQALANSTSVTESYFKDDINYTRDWLLQDQCWLGVEPEHPVYLSRGGTLMTKPNQRTRDKVLAGGKYEKARARGTIKFNTGMTEYKTAVIDGNGRITGEVVTQKANAPVDVKLVEYEQKLAKIELKKEFKG
jgi:SAM-dependent methyltransferase